MLNRQNGEIDLPDRAERFCPSGHEMPFRECAQLPMRVFRCDLCGFVRQVKKGRNITSNGAASIHVRRAVDAHYRKDRRA